MMKWYWVYGAYVDAPYKQGDDAESAGYMKMYSKYTADKVIRHQKYKRCLVMAKMCEAKYDAEDAKVNDGLSWEYISPEMEYWELWSLRWYALAEKFKEAK